MALIGERKRKLNLSIGLPELAVKRSRFVPYSVSATTTVFTTTALFSSSSSSDTNISELDFEKIQVLGHGISGTVYKVCHKATSNHYALKVVHGDSNPQVRRHLLREIDILRRTDSPCVVCCHAVFEKPSGDVSFLMEYMDSGSLETELKSHGKMSESKIADVARQVTKGMFVTPDWAGQDRTQSQSGVWKVKMGGGQLCPVDHFIPNEGDKSDPSGDWVTFVPPNSLRSISGRPLRSIVDLASPSPSKHLAGGRSLILEANYPSKHFWPLVSGSLAYDDIWFGGRTRNPWNIEEFSTGSSAGPAACTSAGVKMVPFELKYAVDSVQGIVNFTMDVDMLAHFDEWQRLGQDDDYESQDQWPTELRRARVFPAVDYVQAQRSRGKLIQEVRESFTVNALIGSATDWERVCMGNLVGLPVIVVPTTFTNISNPPSTDCLRRTAVTTGIYAPPYQDSIVLALAMAYQSVTDHHRQRPPVDDLGLNDSIPNPPTVTYPPRLLHL